MLMRSQTSTKNLFGISLLEMLLVLAIVSTLLFASFGFYQQYLFSSDEQQFQLSIERLQQALLSYFKMGCVNGFAIPGFSFSPSLKMLLHSGVLSMSEYNALVNPWGANTRDEDIQFSITPAAPQTDQLYQLNVTATVKRASDALLPALRGRLGASSMNVADKTLRWQFSPGEEIGEKKSSLWGMRAALIALQQNERAINTSAPIPGAQNMCWPRTGYSG